MQIVFDYFRSSILLFLYTIIFWYIISNNSATVIMLFNLVQCCRTLIFVFNYFLLIFVIDRDVLQKYMKSFVIFILEFFNWYWFCFLSCFIFFAFFEIFWNCVKLLLFYAFSFSNLLWILCLFVWSLFYSKIHYSASLRPVRRVKAGNN